MRPGLNSHDGRVCQANNPVATAPGTDLITKPIRDSPDHAFAAIFSKPQNRSGRRLMRTKQIEVRLLGCLVCAVLLLAPFVIASSASQPDGQQTNQQRPRTVGSQGTTNTQRQTNSSGEEVSEGDVVRVNTQLVSVPTVITDRNGRPVAGLR